MKKISIIIIAIMIILNLCIIPVNAAMDISSITNPSNVPTEVYDKATSIWNNVSVIITTIGVGIAIIMLIVVAVKYMSAAPNDKAEIKKHLVIYVIGAIFIICCLGIVNILKTLAEDILL